MGCKRSLSIFAFSVLLIVCITFLDSCSENPFKDFTASLDSREITASFNITLPENGASFPRNIAPPEFEWDAADNNNWLIRIDLQDGSSLSRSTKENHWVPKSDLWEKIKLSSENTYVTLTVYGYNGETFSRSEPIRFRISSYELDPYIIYRIAHYPLNFVKEKPNLYYRDITELKSNIFLKADKFCFSCHVLSDDGKAMALSTRRYIKIGKKKKKITGVDVLFVDNEKDYLLIENANSNLDIYGSMMTSWSPKNSHLILSVGDKIIGVNILSNTTAKLTYDMGGDIAVYAVGQKVLALLPGANDQSVREFWPYFSANGEIISFSRLYKNGESDIYVLPFNNGKGGKSKPLEGASEKGISEYFQRYSPDGKWIIFNRLQGPTDTFCDLSDLYILPAAGGVPKKLACSKEGCMDSIAAWSSNSRWISFTSRRYKNESRIFFAEIDDQGNAYPPVKMPNQEVEEAGEHPAYHHAYFVKDRRNIQTLADIYNDFNER